MENDTKYPSSIEMEHLCLGVMIFSTDLLNEGVAELEPSDFHLIENHIIFAALVALYTLDVGVSELLLIEGLKKSGELEKAGGIAYIKSLDQYADCKESFAGAIEIIKNKSMLRCIAEASRHIQAKARDEKDTAENILEEAHTALFRIGQRRSSDVFVTVPELLSGKNSESGRSFIRDLQDRQELFKRNGPGATSGAGVKTHLYDLDKLLDGMGNGHLIILGARTGVGKTALALSIAERVAMNDKMAVGIFSLEMPAAELLRRVICSRSNIGIKKIKAGSLLEGEFQMVNVAARELENANIIIDDQSSIKISQLRNRAKRMKDVYDIGLLIIDYLQLLSGSSSYRGAENRQTEVAEISRTLKILAKDLNIPILCLSQLARKVEERTDKRPILSDLRESGAIEQDADAVILLTSDDKKPGLAELILAKNRHGPTGSVEVIFTKEFARFENYQKPEQIPLAYSAFKDG